MVLQTSEVGISVVKGLKFDKQIPGIHPLKKERQFITPPREALADHEVRYIIDAIHSLHGYYFNQSGIRSFTENRQDAVLLPEIRAQAERLRNGVTAFHREVSSTSAMRKLTEFEQRLKAADHESQGQSLEERVAKRRSKFENGRIVVFDMDNTVTDHENLEKIEVNGVGKIDPYILGGVIGEPVIGPDRQYFPEAVAGVWKRLIDSYPEVFYYGGTKAPIREGVGHLFKTLQSQGIGTTLVSANFLPFVEGVVSKVPGHEGLDIYCITGEDIRASSKGDMLKWLALQNPGKAIEFVGDGSTDWPTLEARGVVTAYHALEGESFAKKLAQDEVPHFTYRSGYDLTRHLAAA